MVRVPLTVATSRQQDFIGRYTALTAHNNKTLLFAVDHLVEKNSILNPYHPFAIAQNTKLPMATQLGLISRYSTQNTPEHTGNFILKITAKTPTQTLRAHDPESVALHEMASLEPFLQQHATLIAGIGLTIFIGSAYEESMLRFAATTITQAHQLGLPVVLWTYIRGEKISPNDQINLLPFAANLATSLGADFAKLQLPEENLEAHETIWEKTKLCAGNTRLLFAGGANTDPVNLLQKTDYLVNRLTWDGAAIGRALFMHKIDYACLIAQTMTRLMANQISYETAIAQITKLTV
jgi:DhnA family fructose-bisphosphate aldolase class Ia